jgi:hypothetical protein
MDDNGKFLMMDNNMDSNMDKRQMRATISKNTRCPLKINLKMNQRCF